ncbi:MAG: patatin-like phospholipase family protein [Pseudomonadota bacterium]
MTDSTALKDHTATKLALVLPGGGARGAFQVGVLKAIAELLPARSRNPFRILSGTSAGAINSVVLASKAQRFGFAVSELERVWGGFETSMVYRSDALTMLKSSAHWLAAIVFGGLGVRNPRSLLDNAPLRALLSRNVRFPRIQSAIDKGFLDAVAITAAGYRTSRSVTFYQGIESAQPWARTRRIGQPAMLNLDHLMASIAVPMIFPPVEIDGEYFGDGAMRQATPLSPAVHLGADRILVIGVRDELADRVGKEPGPQEFPGFGQIAGYVLDTLFLDGLYSDMERLARLNDVLEDIPPHARHGLASKMRVIDTMVVLPSVDLTKFAVDFVREMPRPVRLLLRGIGGSEGRLLSFLLFESAYTQALIDQGYRDAMRVGDQLTAFVTGQDVPVLQAPDEVAEDLSGIYRVPPMRAGAS